MSKFLTGKELEDKLTDIIWNAKKYIIIISPFIKLDNYVKNILEKVKNHHDIDFFLLFGKNEESRNSSICKEDFEYFTEFKNITILYNKDLHAKHYCNENEGLITSLNLYDYSMINNVEYGVHFKDSLLSTDNLFRDTETFTDKLLFEKSDVIFLKKPVYSKGLLGLSKKYQDSKIIFDISTVFFNNSEDYDKKPLNDFDLKTETSIEKKYSTKPIREIIAEEESFSFTQTPKTFVSNLNTTSKDSNTYSQKNDKQQEIGYCIRTRREIPFNPQKPFSLSAFRMWDVYGNYDYPENYCHKTGKESYGKTSMANPILKETYK
ncbi:phospholipase D family protein [Tenacibaculum sp. MEBiC06402]|uniref:phospholipase D family protein n=1 Tax=unclassified Tenacibaculum TaxID=2635139 RepID=UPI003B9B1075